MPVPAESTLVSLAWIPHQLQWGRCLPQMAFYHVWWRKGQFCVRFIKLYKHSLLSSLGWKAKYKCKILKSLIQSTFLYPPSSWINKNAKEHNISLLEYSSKIPQLFHFWLILFVLPYVPKISKYLLKCNATSSLHPTCHCLNHLPCVTINKAMRPCSIRVIPKPSAGKRIISYYKYPLWISNLKRNN